MSSENEIVDTSSNDEKIWSNQKPKRPEEDMISYLIGVSGSLQSKLDNDSLQMLLKNVMEEMIDKEASLCTHRKTAEVLELLIVHADVEDVLQFFGNIRKYFGFLCTNRQASYVLQKLFHQMYLILSKVKPEEEPKAKELIDMVADLSRVLIVNELWWDLMADACGTHVIRSLILLLANKPISKSRGGKKEVATSSEDKRSKHHKSTFVASLHSFLVDVSKWERADQKTSCTNTYSSPVIQLLLENCSTKHKAWKSLVTSILSDEVDATKPNVDVLRQLATDQIGSHLVQIIVAHCDDSIYNDVIFEQFLKGHLSELSRDRFANFVLQDALAVMRTPEQCQIVVSELENQIATDLVHRQLGVIWKVCLGCQKADGAVQRQICRAVLRGTHCLTKADSNHESKGGVEMLLFNGKEFGGDVPELASEKSEEFTQVRVSILGARVVGAMLMLSPENARPVLESIASMNADKLRVLCTDPIGGKDVMEVLMDAPESANWAKQRILVKLQDELTLIAENKFGWHVLRKAFDNGTIKERLQIAKAIARKERRILGSSFGTLLHKHCKVALYKSSPEQWNTEQQHIRHKTKTRKLEAMLDELDNTASEKEKSKKHKVSKKSKKSKKSK